MSFDTRLLDIVVCPATHMPLRKLPESLLAQLNERIAAGTLRHVDDSPVTENLEQALVTEDDRLAYPVRDDMPVLIAEQGIVVAQIDEA